MPRTLLELSGIKKLSDFSWSHSHSGEALQYSIYLQMQGVQWQALKGLCFAFLMLLPGQPCTGTSLKPCFNLSELANQPPAGLQGWAVCVWGSLYVREERVCVRAHVCTHTYICPKGLTRQGASLMRLRISWLLFLACNRRCLLE